MDFEYSLKDINAPIAIDFSEDRNVLLIAFGGLAHKLGMPMFEFNKLTSELKNINKIFIRDHNKLWFHSGLKNIAYDIDSVANFLRLYTSHDSTKKVVVVGNSGGGYAALLFGYILQVNEVHAFSAKTSINPFTRLIQKDFPKKDRTKTLWSLFTKGQKRYFDIKKVFQSHENSKTNHHVYFSHDHKSDYFHASRLSNMPNVHLHPYKYNRHNLIQVLKKNGELKTIIYQAVLL